MRRPVVSKDVVPKTRRWRGERIAPTSGTLFVSGRRFEVFRDASFDDQHGEAIIRKIAPQEHEAFVDFLRAQAI